LDGCFFGWLSDKIGRKPIMMLGFLLAAVTYAPISPINIFKGLTHYANPTLEKALASAPVTVVADPSECSFQFKMTGAEKFSTSCDTGKAALVGASVNYKNKDGPKETPAVVKVGDETISTSHQDFNKMLLVAIAKHGAEGRPDANRLSVHDPPARHPRAVRDDGVRADRGLARRIVPDQNSLQWPFAALPHRQWMVWRLPARDCLCDCGRDRRYLFRPLVSGRHSVHELCRGLAVPQRDKGPGYPSIGSIVF
jgi:hypothetical protein